MSAWLRIGAWGARQSTGGYFIHNPDLGLNSLYPESFRASSKVCADRRNGGPSAGVLGTGNAFGVPLGLLPRSRPCLTSQWGTRCATRLGPGVQAFRTSGAWHYTPPGAQNSKTRSPVIHSWPKICDIDIVHVWERAHYLVFDAVGVWKVPLYGGP